MGNTWEERNEKRLGRVAKLISILNKTVGKEQEVATSPEKQKRKEERRGKKSGFEDSNCQVNLSYPGWTKWSG